MMATEYKLSYTASEIDERLGKVDEIDSLKQNLFSGDYNDLKNAPNIIENGDGELFIADQNGNVIFCVNATGVNSVGISVNGADILSIINSKVNETINSAIGSAIAAEY